MDYSGSHVEILVVGAGPAGSAAALLLARTGHEVLVVDQARFPRDKPCGEYLNPAAVAVLRRLGLVEALRVAGARRVAGVRLASPAGREVQVSFPATDREMPEGLSMPRLSLDAALLQAARAAGAGVREGFRVDDVLRAGGRVIGIRGRGERGAECIQARLVLAADGSRSVAARRLALARAPAFAQRVGLVAHYEGVVGEDWVEMHAGERGYCGLGYSAEGRAHVAMVAAPADLPCIRGRPEAFFEERLAQFPGISRRLASGRRRGRVRVTASMTARVSRVTTPGLLLLGDAAGFYDPFTGEGLSYALRGAELAAAAAAAALGTGLRPEDLNHRDTEDTEAGGLAGWGLRISGIAGAVSRKPLRQGLISSPPSGRSLCPLCLCGCAHDSSAEAAAFREYAARRRAEFGPRVLVSRVIQAVLVRPGALEAVFQRFEAEPELAQRLIGVTAGILPARVVMTPGYWTRLLPVQAFRRSGVPAFRPARIEHEHDLSARTPERLDT